MRQPNERPDVTRTAAAQRRILARTVNKILLCNALPPPPSGLALSHSVRLVEGDQLPRLHGMLADGRLECRVLLGLPHDGGQHVVVRSACGEISLYHKPRGVQVLRYHRGSRTLTRLMHR